ncbi:hypothetical protein ZWY2020_009912 [Hordeum vulgare]|nr:hypothetical protein ZWY2020_009912 [Hordeum vulgare]
MSLRPPPCRHFLQLTCCSSSPSIVPWPPAETKGLPLSHPIGLILWRPRCRRTICSRICTIEVCSSWDEDDEDALRWAALEKLPTYDRTRTAVLAMPEGELKKVNADKLGAQQRLASVGDDHECFLSKFKDRVDRYAPQLELLTSSLEFLSQVYNECATELRVGVEGEFHMGRESVDEYCGGACFAETEMALRCVEEVTHDGFTFSNGASLFDVKQALG